VKITTLSTLLSVLSLAAVAVLFVKVDELSDELRLARSSRADVSRTTPEDEQDRSYRDTSYRTASRGDFRDGDAKTGALPAGASDGEEAADPHTVEDRLARLEREAKRSREMPTRMFRAPKFARNVDDLSDRLNLSRSQRDRVEEAVRRGKERIDAIMSIPGVDGKSPKQAREERMEKLREAMKDPEKNAGGIFSFAIGGRKRMNEKIPGSNETYSDQIKRIKKETREEVGANLSPEQQKEFKDTNIDPMLGGGGGTAMSFVTTSTMGDSGEDGHVGGIVIESGEDVSVDVVTEDE